MLRLSFPPVPPTFFPHPTLLFPLRISTLQAHPSLVLVVAAPAAPTSLPHPALFFPLFHTPILSATPLVSVPPNALPHPFLLFPPLNTPTMLAPLPPYPAQVPVLPRSSSPPPSMPDNHSFGHCYHRFTCAPKTFPFLKT